MYKNKFSVLICLEQSIQVTSSINNRENFVLMPVCSHLTYKFSNNFFFFSTVSKFKEKKGEKGKQDEIRKKNFLKENRRGGGGGGG